MGAQSVRDIVRATRQLGIDTLTLYAFSAQNWARPVHEVRGLMQLLRDFILQERAEIMDNDIRLHAIGDIDRLPGWVREPLDALVEDSRKHDAMHLVLALSYGGRESIAQAARALAEDVCAGDIEPSAIDSDTFKNYLPTRDLPPIDLVIRTSGEQRVSNFMLWELAYAELIFVDTLWPDFRRQHLYDALEIYSQRQRRFGMTGMQVADDSDLAPVPPPVLRAGSTQAQPAPTDTDDLMRGHASDKE